jgi:glycosyltransferase involved in cell wall biosynthesis
LVTDCSGAEGSWVAKLAERAPSLGAGSFARRDARRIPAELLFQSTLLTAASRLSERVVSGLGPFVEDFGLGLLAQVAKRDAAVVYTVYGGGERYLRRARARGAKVVSDVIITPLAHRIVEEERRRFPDWESRAAPSWLDRWIDAKTERMIDVSDVLLCPSESVIDGLSAFTNFDPSRAVVLPYASRFETRERSTPIPGRVLFVGSASLRKGIQYLARAARIVQDIDRSVEFIVAGPVTDMIRARHETERLTFLGKLDSSRLAEEYVRADLFVLPTLAEGSAGVVYEALAFGLPVVTTHAAGSIVRDGVEGRIVPERDSEALAEAIVAIVKDRSTRERYAVAARNASADDQATWGAKLLAILSADG